MPLPHAIPVIDLADHSPEGTARTAAAIRAACCDTGFFYVTGHSVPPETIAALETAARTFFALPDADKDKVHFQQFGNHLGFEPAAAQTLEAGTPPDAKESFMFGRDLPADHPYVVAGFMGEGTNQWPAALPALQAAGDAYMAAMLALGRKLARLLALSLGEKADTFEAALADPAVGVRLLHYPPGSARQDDQMGAGAHTDWGFLTILLQDAVGGLEVRNREGTWVRAEPVPGSFVINLGDMVPQLTNGLYHSTLHRVRPSASDRPRYSIATFFNPAYDYEFNCLEACLGEDTAIAPISFGAHIQAMFRRTYGIEA